MVFVGVIGNEWLVNGWTIMMIYNIVLTQIWENRM